MSREWRPSAKAVLCAVSTFCNRREKRGREGGEEKGLYRYEKRNTDGVYGQNTSPRPEKGLSSFSKNGENSRCLLAGLTDWLVLLVGFRRGKLSC
jgi:hypothetical protein